MSLSNKICRLHTLNKSRWNSQRPSVQPQKENKAYKLFIIPERLPDIVEILNFFFLTFITQLEKNNILEKNIFIIIMTKTTTSAYGAERYAIISNSHQT